MSKPAEMIRPTPRRWLCFSLRTLFVVVTLACVWLGYQLNLVHQRQAYLAWLKDGNGWAVAYSDKYPWLIQPGVVPPAKIPHIPSVSDAITQAASVPKWRRWLGDQPMYQIDLMADATEEDRDNAQGLFPEAKIVVQRLLFKD